MYRSVLKFFIDWVLAVMGFVVFLPLFTIICLLLAFANRGRIFFLQQRPGKNRRIFKIIKFRTMNNRKDKNGLLLPDKDRLTKIGSFVRRTSLDEIPQLLNVIKGDMSLVGPRPLLVEYLPLYNTEQNRRHEVRPGITGWAQVNGRNAISWEEKFKCDIWYVNNISLIVDLKIIYLTILKVFKSEGISSATSVTMEKFKGGN